jgi:hypothetical protein
VYFYMPESQSLMCGPAECIANYNLANDRTVTLSAVLVERDGTRVQSQRIDAFAGIEKPLCDTDAGCGPVFSARLSGRQTLEFRFLFTPDQLAKAEQLVVTSEVT